LSLSTKLKHMGGAQLQVHSFLTQH